MAQSRYIRTRQIRRTKRHHPVYVWGAEEEHNKFVRCWNCHNIVNLDYYRPTGDGSGRVYTDATPVTYPVGSGDENIFHVEMSSSNNAQHDFCVLQSPDNYTEYTPRNVEAASGCPFCGVNIF
jgi:hypothetical protein